MINLSYRKKEIICRLKRSRMMMKILKEKRGKLKISKIKCSLEIRHTRIING
jgi:hypothetical protein